MPQRKSVQSLSHLCVQNVVNNLDKFDSRADARQGISMSGDKDELSCFEGLPSQLVVSIMDAALTKGCPASKDKNLLALLITTHLDTLDLTQWTTSAQQYTKLGNQTILHLLRTAALRHSHLKTLGFSLSGSVPCLIFKELLPAFPNLKKLNVSDSSDETINDDFLALLPTCCPNLEELRLFWCIGVTDVGIQQLCGSQEGAHGGVDRGCKSLLRLNVERTGVTRRGARLALEHLPRLQIFDYRSTLQIAAEMHRTNGARLLNLKNLNAECVNWADDDEVRYMRGSWIHAVRLCPLVIHVNLTSIRSSDDADLAALLNLKCLKKLAITFCLGMSFDGGLLPILKKFGPSSLESLTFWGGTEVNIGSIVEFCSELREIRLGLILRYSPATRSGLRRTSPGHHLPHLRRLTIRGHFRDLPEDQPSHADLSLLLSSAPALERIALQGLSHLNDGILKEAMALHGFTHLQGVIINFREVNFF